MNDVTGEPASLPPASEDAARPAPRVVVADDHPDLLAETQSLLEPDFEVVCLATGGAALMRAVLEAKPDGVVSDVQMPGLNGIEAGSEIVRQGLCENVIMLSMHNDPQLLSKALNAGIRGYVLKEDAGEELIPALRAVLAGGRYFSRGVKSAGPD
jgi:two-component system response regulator NreC